MNVFKGKQIADFNELRQYAIQVQESPSANLSPQVRPILISPRPCFVRLQLLADDVLSPRLEMTADEEEDLITDLKLNFRDLPELTSQFTPRHQAGPTSTAG